MARSVAVALWLLGCGADDASGHGGAKAVSTKSGLDPHKALASLSDDERMQFCAAAVKTLFSATTPDRECEVSSVLTTTLLPGQSATCEQLKSDCLKDFVELEVQRCAMEIASATGCEASVGDGETCVLETGTAREEALPHVSCASDVKTVQGAVSEIYAANARAPIAECHRYNTCRMSL